MHKIWAKRYYRMKCTYCTVYWHTSSHRGALRLAMCFLSYACFRKICACVSDALRVDTDILLTICSCNSLPLSALFLILSADTVYIFLMIWIMYFPVEWEFIATVTAHCTLTTALHWGHTFRLMEHCAKDIPIFRWMSNTRLWHAHNCKAGN